ncbi:MAG: hypothetical protein ACRD0P_18595 [Stackebrandtia sp.]
MNTNTGNHSSAHTEALSNLHDRLGTILDKTAQAREAGTWGRDSLIDALTNHIRDTHAALAGLINQ